MPPRTVKQTEIHLCVLTVNLPHIDCCYKGISIGDGASW